MFLKIEAGSDDSAKKILSVAQSYKDKGLIAACRFDSAVVIEVEDNRLGIIGAIQSAGTGGYTVDCTSDDIAELRRIAANG